jgi:GMP synthase-like glutamine amidotransferase
MIVVNNDDPDSDYGAKHLAAAFAAVFSAEIVSPLEGFPSADDWIRGGAADALVLSGSDRSVREALPWMLEEEELLREAVGARVPVLAICFGHQLVGEAFGAGIETREKRIGLFEVAVVGRDPAFDGLGDSATVPEQHADQLSRVPDGFELIATSDYCPVQAVRHASAPAYGMQFHPCYEESVFEADEAWEALPQLRESFRHDGPRILANVARIFAEVAAQRGGVDGAGSG